VNNPIAVLHITVRSPAPYGADEGSHAMDECSTVHMDNSDSAR
jgi:hypothetical protein